MVISLTIYGSRPNRRKFGDAQGVLKRKPIHMAEFEIVLLDLENPGYGDVASFIPIPRHVPKCDISKNIIVWCGSHSHHYFCTVAKSGCRCNKALPNIVVPANRQWKRILSLRTPQMHYSGLSFEFSSCPHSPGFTGAHNLHHKKR